MLGTFYKFDVICQDQRECMKDQIVGKYKKYEKEETKMMVTFLQI